MNADSFVDPAVRSYFEVEGNAIPFIREFLIRAQCASRMNNAGPKQATLFSFMKKKDPNEIAEAKTAMNFVTPAEKVTAPVEVKAVEVKEIEKEKTADESLYFAEADEDIERLVSRPSAGTPTPAPSPSVVDLTTTADVVTDVKKNLLPSAVKPRRKAPKKAAPKAAEKKSAACLAGSNAQPAAVTPEKDDAALYEEAVPAPKDEAASNMVADSELQTPPEADGESAVSAADNSSETTPVVAAAVAPVTPAPSAAKKRVRKPAAKKIEAAESAALDPETEGGAAAEEGAEVTTPGDEEDSAGKPSAKRVRKTPAKPAAAAIVYPAHVEVKLQANREKLSTLVQELVALERAEDCVDLELDIAQAADDLLDAAQQTITDDLTAAVTEDATPGASDATEAVPMDVDQEAVEAPEAPVEVYADAAAVLDVSAEPAAADGNAEVDAVVVTAQAAPLSAEEKAKAHVVALVKAYVARSVQGSSASLKEVVASTRAGLQAVHDKVAAQTASESTGEEGVSHTLEGKPTNAVLVQEALARLLDNVVLAEEIKILAARQSYGNRGEKSLMFDCTDALAVWRWETLSPVHFTKSAQAILREVRAVRGRYSRALKAIYRVVEQLQKVPYSEAKLAPLEERSAKCMTEVEKAKEKRRETETKRAADAAERKRKEELREQKRLEKEEADRARKAASEAAAAAKAAQSAVEKEKKAPVVNEKALKKAQELEKSKNMFMNFLKSSAPAASASSASASSSAPTAAPSSSHSNSSSASQQNASPLAGSSSCAEALSEKMARFDAAMKTDMPLSEIMRCQRERYQSRPARRAPRRPRYIDLHVTVIVPDPRNRGAFDASDNTFSEIQEKTFHNKVRTLSFWEDHRPAYVGTVSRKSRIICGRRPLAKDTELLNYEYDSEEDWEEEVEGEDLNETDEEEEEAGANELEYDDFFCRDDDYGSDAEGDMDGAAVRVSQRNVIEVFGPRFVDPAVLSAVTIEPRAAEDGAEKATVGTSSARKLDEPISTFTIFDLSSGELRSQPAKGDADANNLSSYTAICYAHFPVPTMGTFEAKKSAAQGGAGAAGEQGAETKAPRGFDETKLPELARYVHGKKEGIDKLVLGFHALHPTIPKLQIQKRIKDIADKTKHADGYGTSRFVVKAEMLEKLQIQAEELDAVIFTPQKKKKRAAVTVVASSLEELLAQQGEKAALFPALVASSAATAAAAAPAASTAAAVPMAASANSSSSSSGSSSSANATQQSAIATPAVKPKAAKLKAPKAPAAMAATACADGATQVVAAKKPAQKRKIDPNGPAPAPKKAATKAMAATAVAASPVAAPAAVAPAVVPVPAKQVVSVAAPAAPVVKATPAASSVKKITSFLLSPGARAAASVSAAVATGESAKPSAKESPSNEAVTAALASPTPSGNIIEIDME